VKTEKVAHCDDQIRRLPDGRYLVQVNDVTVALPEEDPKHKQIGFYVSTPPGTSPFTFISPIWCAIPIAMRRYCDRQNGVRPVRGRHTTISARSSS
jgi:hypothetical protein